MSQISVAISDLVLSVTSFYGAGIVARRYIHAAVGLLFIGFAAGVGTIRFLNVAPLNRRNDVISLHTRLSWLATILGIPLIAASFSIKYGSTTGSQLHVISGIAGVILSVILPNVRDPCTSFVSTFGILSILFESFQAKNVLALAGAILYAVSGTVVGTTGYMMGFHRVNIFHYCLVAANVIFVQALL